MSTEIPGTHQKALRINLDPSKYGTCVEIGAGPGVVGVRDTKQPAPRPILVYSATAFAAFLAHLTGER